MIPNYIGEMWVYRTGIAGVKSLVLTALFDDGLEMCNVDIHRIGIETGLQE
jgi:hypothetical protein